MARKIFRLPEVKILWANFAGAKKRFNEEGKRNFNIIVPRDMVEEFIDFGFNIKRFEETENNPDPDYYMKVNVNFKSNFPPKVVMVTSKSKVLLNENTIGAALDGAIIEYGDIVIAGSLYEGHVSAYLQKGAFYLSEDDWDKEYAVEEYPEEDIPDDEELPFK